MDVGSPFEDTLYSIHLMLAAFVKEPAMALDKREAKDLAKAIARVQEHYELPGLSPKHQAMAGLLVTAGRIYGPRAVILAAKARANPRGAPAARPGDQGAHQAPGGASSTPPGADLAQAQVAPWWIVDPGGNAGPIN